MTHDLLVDTLVAVLIAVAGIGLGYFVSPPLGVAILWGGWFSWAVVKRVR